jgi:flagellar basal-body rod protein FlgG
MQVATFQNPAGLQALGGNLYKETIASGAALLAVPGQEGAGSLMQGTLENSNVNVAEELINMIVAQRTYEANSKVMQTTSQLMTNANQIV